MKLTVKIISLFVLLSLASPVLFLKGCGETLNGGACGGCPDSSAPIGSIMIAPELASATINTDGAACSSAVSFQLTDADGAPLNNLCVEIFTNAFVALHNSGIECNAHPASDFYTYIRTRTNDQGVVSLDFLIASPCSVLGTGATTGSFWVHAVSCSASASATADVTINGTCP